MKAKQWFLSYHAQYNYIETVGVGSAMERQGIYFGNFRVIDSEGEDVEMNSEIAQQKCDENFRDHIQQTFDSIKVKSYDVVVLAFIQNDLKLTKHEHYGISIAKERNKQGITQEQLAQQTGISPRTLSNIESGSPSVSIGTINRIREALGMTELE